MSLSLLSNKTHKISSSSVQLNKPRLLRARKYNPALPSHRKFNHGVKKLDFSKIHPVIKSAVTALARKKTILLEREAINTKPIGWFSDNKTDSKTALNTIDRELALIDSELSMARGMLKNFLGPLQVFPIKLYQSYNQTSNAGGVLVTSATIEPSAISEFIAAASLFDEYRVVGVRYEFLPHGVITVPTATTGILAHAACAYDPSDGTANSSVTEVLQHQQHLLFDQSVAASNTTSTVTTNFSRHHTFAFRVPPGVLQANANAISEWQPAKAGSSYLPYGWLKFYGSNYNSVTGVIGGILIYDVEFRIRE